MSSLRTKLRAFLGYLWNGPGNLPRTLEAEWHFISIRWMGILCALPGLQLLPLPPDRVREAYAILAVAAVYNIALQCALPRKPGLFSSGSLTTAGDALLNLAMLHVGGGFSSPFYAILFTVTISAAMRYGYGPAIGMACFYVAADAISLGLARAPIDGAFFLRGGFLVITGILASYLQQQAKRAEAAFQEQLRQAKLLNDVTGTIAGTLEFEQVARGVAEAAAHLVGGSCAVLQPVARSGERVQLLPPISWCSRADCSADHAALAALCRAAASVPLAPRPVLTPLPLVAGSEALILRLTLPTHEYPVAALAVRRAAGAARVELDPDTLESFAARSALGIENAALYRTQTSLYQEVRRQAEALRTKEAHLSAVLENVAEGIVTMDARGRITSFNRAAEQVFGRAEREVLGLSIGELLADGEPWEGKAGLIPYLRPVSELAGSAPREAVGRRKDGTAFPIDLAVSEMRSGSQDLFIACVRDITDRKQSEAALEHQALHDQLTALPNRTLLQDRLEQTILATRRDDGSLALLLMDLDRFKEVNDTFGHLHGDRLLQQIGARLRMVLRAGDTIARLGGDEFAVVLPRVEALEATQAALRLLEALEEPFIVDGQPLAVGASIGVAVYPDHGEDPETLLRCADVAMYVAKRSGGGHAIYAPEDDQNSASRLALYTELRHAIEEEDLALHYQPKFECQTGRVAGVEALVRWAPGGRGLIPPEEFIPLAEQTGLIKPLCLWVLDAALHQQRTWRQAGLTIPVAVNLSMRNLHDKELPDTIGRLLRAYRTEPSLLTLELTESVLMADPERALHVLTMLRGMGLRISIDDFGTGYSSLAYLKRLPVVELKIDRSFVRQMAEVEEDATIVRSTIGLAHDLGLKVVAEGVENAATWQRLGDFGCDVAQGFYLSHPLPAEECTRLLKEASGIVVSRVAVA